MSCYDKQIPLENALLCAPLANMLMKEALKEEMAHFKVAYSIRDPHTISDRGILDYTNMVAQLVIPELRGANLSVIRYIYQNPEIFVEMEDFVIPASAAFLWGLTRGSLTPEEATAATEQAKFWFNESKRVMGRDGAYPLRQRWSRLGLAIVGRWQEDWLTLMGRTLWLLETALGPGQGFHDSWRKHFTGEQIPLGDALIYVQQSAKKKAKILEDKLRVFEAKYPIHNPYDLPSDGILYYRDLSRRLVVREMQAANLAVVVHVYQNPELFEEMGDFIILASAAYLYQLSLGSVDAKSRDAANAKGRAWFKNAKEAVKRNGACPLHTRLGQMGLPELCSCGEWRTLMYSTFKLIKM